MSALVKSKVLTSIIIPGQAQFVGRDLWEEWPAPGAWTWATRNFKMVGVIGRSPDDETVMWLRSEGFKFQGDEDKLTIIDSWNAKRPWTIENGIWKPTGYPNAPLLPPGYKTDD